MSTHQHMLQEETRAVLLRQAWAGRFLLLAILLGTATGLFIAFFNIQQWQTAAIRWAYRNEEYYIAARINEGLWSGLTWQEWSTVGVVATVWLVVLSIVLTWRAENRLHRTPGLRQAVKEEHDRRWSVIGAILLAPLIVAFMGIIIGAALAGAGNYGDHRHHSGDID